MGARSAMFGLLAITMAASAATGCHRLPAASSLVRTVAPAADVIVIGAGISGLAAALEAAAQGASVTVVEASTVGGGHAILSSGAVALVDTPYQRARRIVDSPALAEKDFFARGEDPNPDWVRAYVRDSKAWLYDWLIELGVEWEVVIRAEGNSVSRLHRARNKGIGLIAPMLRRAHADPRINFLWATRADELIVSNLHAEGVRVTNLRTGQTSVVTGRSIIVATGGFQSNLERVLANWPPELPRPGRLLLGAAESATGGGHDLVVSVGGTMSQLDHQWNYVLGFPDVRDPAGQRGLAAFNLDSIWVNRDGRRFVREYGDEKVSLKALLEQPEGRYFALFDEKTKDGFSITLAGWENAQDVWKVTFDSGLILTAATLEELAGKMKIDPMVLRATVRRYNGFVAARRDEDFGRFGPSASNIPPKIETPPFYAAPFFPITRKSMGGVRVDIRTRILRESGVPMTNLFAVGEVTGFAGINGKAALEGTFLGPAMYMGRIAGRVAAESSGATPRAPSPAAAPGPAPRPLPGGFDDLQCLACHNVAADVKRGRAAFWHFEQSHAKVLDRQYTCARCHADLAPFQAARHRLDRSASVTQCVVCHGVQSSGAPTLD